MRDPGISHYNRSVGILGVMDPVPDLLRRPTSPPIAEGVMSLARLVGCEWLYSQTVHRVWLEGVLYSDKRLLQMCDVYVVIHAI